jgi:hypothetical protein
MTPSSTQNVRFDCIEIDADPEFLAMYDAAAGVWQEARA